MNFQKHIFQNFLKLCGIFICVSILFRILRSFLEHSRNILYSTYFLTPREELRTVVYPQLENQQFCAERRRAIAQSWNLIFSRNVLKNFTNFYQKKKKLKAYLTRGRQFIAYTIQALYYSLQSIGHACIKFNLSFIKKSPLLLTRMNQCSNLIMMALLKFMSTDYPQKNIRKWKRSRYEMRFQESIFLVGFL